MNVLILGASRGIGLELTRQHQAAGDRVIATARGDEGLKTIQQAGAKPLKLDITDTASTAGLARRLDGESFDTVWLVAGVYGPRSSALQSPTEEEFNTVMHTNVLAAMRVLPIVAEALAPQARIAVISSRMGSISLRSNPSGWLYRASKAALNSLMKDVSLALEGRAICVSLHPGWVRTDMGGTDADIEVEHSVRTMRETVAALTPADNGSFLNHDGERLSW
ncbi:SDR family oxidoreductase [Aquabacterium sp.]|uniref:SDR family oxidoreductase n=1 Tax=Aquabacterium sp. TaxID=1872578 RepID=UPI002C62ED82|nr:SDR family oxidoreductase [Aquabacterium sp.]HSW05412.1 SDR family oxidoreductase [Aquabacterium sp.]